MKSEKLSELRKSKKPREISVNKMGMIVKIKNISKCDSELIWEKAMSSIN